MKMYAVIDTNVFVSALLSRNADAATSKILFAVLNQKLLPLYNEAIPRKPIVVTPAEMVEILGI